MKVIEGVLPLSEDWHRIRRSSLTGSDVAAALGLHPRRSAYKVWAEKTGRAEPEDLSVLHYVRAGNYFEDGVARWFSDDTGLKLAPAPGLVQHDDLSWLYGTPDRLILGVHPHDLAGDSPGGVLECKTGNLFALSDWENDTPVFYQVQLQVYMEIMGLEWGSVAGVLGGQHFRFRHYMRDQEFCELMLEKLEKFWEYNVLGDHAPPVQEGDLEVLKSLWPDSADRAVELSIAGADAALEALSLREQISILKRDLEVQEAKVLDELQDAERGVAPEVTVSCKTQERKAYEVKASKFRVMRIKRV